jgi:transposase
MTNATFAFWTSVLSLPGYEVLFCQKESDLQRYRLTVAPTQRLAVCPHCGHACDNVHQTRTREHIKDLSIGAQSVELNVRVHQFECDCGRCFTPAIPFLAEGSHATERFLERAAELIRVSDVANAAAFLGVPERTLADWYYDFLQRRPNPTGAPPKVVKRIGIDELSLKKKHQQYVAVIVDHDNQRVLEVLENREKATILAYLQRARKEGLLAHVEEVTIDMWASYACVAREAFGTGVAITIDRFHVMKNFQECLTEARRELQRQMSGVERDELKGSRWLWVKNPENLTPEEQKKLQRLKERFPTLGQIADQREALRAIFEDRRIPNPTVGQQRLQGWVEQVEGMGIKALAPFCKTMRNWLDKIANYFRSRSSNGRTEGLNHGLRAIIWRAFGMVNFENFRLRVLHCFGLGLA